MEHCGYCFFYQSDTGICRHHMKGVKKTDSGCEYFDDDYDERLDDPENWDKNILT